MNLNHIQIDGHEINDSFGTAFAIAGFEFRWYGIFYALGIFIAIIFTILKLRTFYKVDDTPFYYYIFIAIPTILLGARVWSFVIGDAKVGSVGFFDFRSGGLAVHGGVIFTTLAGILWFGYILRKPNYFVTTNDEIMKNGVLLEEANARQVSIWVFADAIIPTILVGQALGRWGNFFNHEVFGDAIQTAPNGFASKDGLAFSQWGWLRNFMPSVWEHMWIDHGSVGLAFRVPIFLIESFMNVIGFLFLYYVVEFIRGYRAGTIAFGYFLWSGIVRLVIEIFRNETFKFATSIVTSAAFIIAGFLGIVLTIFVAPKLRKYRVIYFVWIETISWFVAWFNFMSQKGFAVQQKKKIYQFRNEWRNRHKFYQRDFYEMYHYNDNVLQKPYVIQTKLGVHNGWAKQS